MPGTLLWNLALTATAAVGLALLCRLGPLQRRPALRHWLWLLLIVKVVTPPLISLPMLPAVRSDPPPAVIDSETALATRTEAVAVADSPTWADAEGKRKSEWGEWSEKSEWGKGEWSKSGSPDDVPGSDVIGADEDEAASCATNQAVAPARTAAPSYATIAAAVSVLGTCVFLTLGAVRLVRLRRWIRRADNEAPVLSEICAELAAKLGIRGGVEGRVVDTRITPFLWGWRRHRVVLPRKLVEELSHDRLRGIVAHELGHLVRRDHWVNLFVFVVKAAMWWNPVIWWAERELTAAQELCCDAIAVDLSGTDRRGYAATLLEAIEFIQHEPFMSYAPAPGMGSKRSILRRFEMIGETRLSHRLSWRAMLLLLVFVLPLLCIPVRAQEEKPGKKPAVAATETTDAKKKADPPSKDEKSKDAKEKPATPRRERVVGKRPRGNCSISGKVVSAETGEPIANGRMYLHYNVTHGSIFVNTASDGTFAFENIPEGPFSLQLSLSPGWQDVAYDPDGKSANVKFAPFSLKEGEHRSGIVLKAKPAYEIAGKVRDEKGNLPKNIKTLTVLGWFRPEGSKAYTNMQARVDRKDGSYVLDGLNGKPVYVMAIDWQAAKKGTARPPIYYPGTFSRSEAKPVVFGKKRRVEGIDITLRKEGGLVLEGTIVDESGKPVPEAFVVAHRPDMLFDFVTAYTDEKGQYRIDGLGEGAFLVHVDAVHRGFVRTRTPVELNEENKTTTHDFTLNRGVEISGKLVDEKGNDWHIGSSYGHADVIGPDGSGQGSGSFSLTNFRNKHRVTDIRMGSGGSFSLGEGDYQDGKMLFPTKNTFVIQGVKPGRTRITFSPKKEGQGVVKILRDDKDVLKSGLETKPGEKIENLTIVIGKPPVSATQSETEGDFSIRKSRDETVDGKRPRGNCSIRGKLVSAETGEPIAGGRMYLFYMVTYGAIFANTAADGTFAFEDIPEGPFSLALSLNPGWQDVSYNPGGKSTNSKFVPFSLKKGEHRSGIVLKAKRAYEIAGRVLDENGNLPEDIKTLTVLGWYHLEGSKAYTSVQARIDRKDGSYLLDGLNGKPVYVMAINWREAKKGTGYPPIYYPGTFSRSDAKPVVFGEKHRVEGIDITRRKEGGLVLEGTVVDESGKPVPEAFIAAHRPDMLFDLVTAYTDEKGRYRIDGLGEGAFLVHVDAVHRGFVRTRTPVELDKKNKTTTHDFTLNRGVEISGRLVDEEGNDWRIGRSHGGAYVLNDDGSGQFGGGFSLTDFRNKHRMRDIGTGSGSSFSPGEGDYQSSQMLLPTVSTFVIQGVKPGHTKLTFSPQKEGQEVVKILYGGKDVLKSGLETKPGEKIEGLKIVIGKPPVAAKKSKTEGDSETRKSQDETVSGDRPRGNCSISGKLVSAKTGEPIENGQMYLFDNVTCGAIFLRTAADGTFVFKDIPKGPFSLKLSACPGYQDVEYNPDGKPAPLPPFALEEGEHRSGIVLEAEPARAIAGKVRDEDGDIPENIKTLSVLGWVEKEDGKGYTGRQAVVNKQDGSYLLDGLGNEPVYVMAIDWQRAKKGIARPPVYYPSTFFRKDAKPITFDGKSRVDGVDITLKKEGGLVLEGTVVDEAGKPVPGAFVVAHRPEMRVDFVTAYTDDEGRYRIDGLGEGAFLVHVDAAYRGLVRTRTPVDLDGKSEKTERNFTLKRGVEISGKLVDEEGNDWDMSRSRCHGHADVETPGEPGVGSGEFFSLTSFRNKFSPKNIRIGGSGGDFALGEGEYAKNFMLFPTNTTFIIPCVKPGHTTISFSPREKGQKVLKILVGGKDVLKSGIETKAGEDLKDVRIVIGKESVAATKSEEKSEEKSEKKAEKKIEKTSKKKGEKEQKKEDKEDEETKSEENSPSRGKPADNAGTPKSENETVHGERPRGNCSIRGKVVSAETGEPIEGGTMYLSYHATFGAIYVRTAADGTFAFEDIPKGPFSLTLSNCSGYQNTPYNPNGEPASYPFPSFALEEGEHRSGIVLEAKPAYAVSGKIRDENGNVPENAKTLKVLGWFKKDGWKAYCSAKATVDPADGSYVLDGLGGDPVYVMAIDWRGAQEGNAHPPIYYPGTFSRKDAKLVTFDEKRRVDGIDIAIKKEGGLVLEGTVVDEAGKPVPEAFVVAYRPDMFSDFVTAYTDDQGRYRIHGLGEGAFQVHVDAAHRGLIGTRTPLDLDGKSEKTELNFTLNRGVEISGKFVDEEGADWEIGESHGDAHLATRKEPATEYDHPFGLSGFSSKHGPRSVDPEYDGNVCMLGEGDYPARCMVFPTKSTFVIPGMKPGHTMLHFSPAKERQKVVKILVDGKDVLKSGIETKPGEDVKDVRIVIGKE